MGLPKGSGGEAKRPTTHMFLHLAAAFYHLTDGLYAAPARGFAGFYYMAVSRAIDNSNNLCTWGKTTCAVSDEAVCQSRSQLRTGGCRNELIGPTLTGSSTPLLVDAPPNPSAPAAHRL